MSNSRAVRAAILCLLLAGATLSGCEDHRKGGRCIGVSDDPEPGVKYEVSVQNIVVGAILIETIFVPIIVLLKEIRCPIEAAAAQPPSAIPSPAPPETP